MNDPFISSLRSSLINFVLDEHTASLGCSAAAEGEVQLLWKDLSVKARLEI